MDARWTREATEESRVSKSRVSRGEAVSVRAVMIEKFGAAPVVAEVAEPVAAPGEALVDVRLAALNPVDLKIASGAFYGSRPELPYVAGSEGMGIVRESSLWPAGTRVRFGAARPGCLAQTVAVDDRLLVEVPDGVEDAAAAGVGIAGLAAFQSLSVARLSAGERVLVLGATGVVGQLAVQAAGIIGAGKVVAAGRDAEQLGRLGAGPDGVADRVTAGVAAGTDRLVTVALTDEDPEVSAQTIVRAAGGEVDVIVDPLWGRPALAALIAAAPGGRLVNLGDSAGPLLDLPSSLLRSRGLSVIGYTNFGLAPEEQLRLLGVLFEHLAAGRLQLATEVLACEKAADAWRRQVISPHRKLLIDVS